jgi:hypothetical protein
MSNKPNGYLSLRSLPQALERKIVSDAKRRHMTKTHVVIEALEKSFGTGARDKRRSAVRRLAGFLSKAEARRLADFVSQSRKIESEIWR